MKFLDEPAFFTHAPRALWAAAATACNSQVSQLSNKARIGNVGKYQLCMLSTNTAMTPATSQFSTKIAQSVDQQTVAVRTHFTQVTSIMSSLQVKTCMTDIYLQNECAHVGLSHPGYFTQELERAEDAHATQLRVRVQIIGHL